MRQILAVLYGKNANKVWLFVHGRCECKEQGLAFSEIVCRKKWQVLAIDLPAHGARKEEPRFDPWHVVPELREVMTCLKHRLGPSGQPFGSLVFNVVFCGYTARKGVAGITGAEYGKTHY